MSHAVVLLSGGMDSTALAYHAAITHDRADLISIDYGQRHHIELSYAERTASRLGCRHDVVNLSGLRQLLTGSALTDDVDVPHGHYTAETMAATVVPNRNATLIAVAYMAAVARTADTLLVAVHAGDHAVYPDCRPEFIEQLGRTLAVGNDGFAQPALLAPFVHITKTDICRLGDRLGVNWDDTWSCYEGGPVHCGRCGTCVERREAFRDAGVHDPTVYADPDFAFRTLAEAGR